MENRTPARDRIAATTTTVLLHACVIAAVVSWQSGGSPGRGPLDDANGQGAQTWVSADFLGEPSAPVPQPATVPQRQTPAPVAHTRAAVPRADEGTAAIDPPAHAASPTQARSGGGDGTPEEDLGARYLAAVRKAILDQWTAQGGGAIPAGCKIRLDQEDGGVALRAWVIDCGDLPLPQRIRLETAAMQARPLPYAGFEPVFQEHLELTF